MGFLMDTNVLSELRKKNRADVGVVKWFEEADEKALFISALTLGEIRNGVERIRRRDVASAVALETWLVRVEQDMSGRILSVTRDVAEYWGRLGVPDPLPVIDSLLAATALVHDLTLVTRNVNDVERSGVKLINPFSS